MTPKPVSFKDFVNAFTKSLKETGFGVITDHPIDLSLMERVYNEWKQFFNSDSKFEYLFDPQKQDGYFPLGLRGNIHLVFGGQINIQILNQS